MEDEKVLNEVTLFEVFFANIFGKRDDNNNNNNNNNNNRGSCSERHLVDRTPKGKKGLKFHFFFILLGDEKKKFSLLVYKNV